jgi:AcrR family transcriptional regulator
MAEEGDRAATGRLAWWPETRTRNTDRDPLTRDQIIAAAIKLIDAEGLDGFSMRRLGQVLDSGATSVYWHVKDKDQLIDLVLDEVVGEVRLDDDPAWPWRRRAAYFAGDFRRVVKRHHHLASLAGSQIAMGPNLLRAMEHLMAILRAGGFTGSRLTLGFSAVLTFALGTGILESREMTGPGSEGRTASELQELVADMFASLPADEYPNLVRIIPDSDPSKVDEDAQFDYGLQRLLDGMESDLNDEAAGQGSIGTVGRPGPV